MRRVTKRDFIAKWWKRAYWLIYRNAFSRSNLITAHRKWDTTSPLKDDSTNDNRCSDTRHRFSKTP